MVALREMFHGLADRSLQHPALTMIGPERQIRTFLLRVSLRFIGLHGWR